MVVICCIDFFCGCVYVNVIVIYVSMIGIENKFVGVEKVVVVDGY